MTSPNDLLLRELEATTVLIHQRMAPTPLHRWPLVDRRAGADVWVKHENAGPIGCVARREAIAYLDQFRQRFPDVEGVVTASHGNHGLAVALAAAEAGLSALTVLPEGSEARKRAAIEATGGEVILAGDDLEEALEVAERLAAERHLHLVPCFHPWLVQGAASAALELFRAAPVLDSVYVPLGPGVVISALILVRDLLGLPTRVVGVVAQGAPAYADSFWAERPMPRPSANTIASELAWRKPDPMVVDILVAGADRLVTVSDEEIVAAANFCFEDTRNLVEGAAAAAYAGLLAERETLAGKAVGLVLTGGNVEAALLDAMMALREPD